MAWLASRPGAAVFPTPREVLRLLPRFQKARARLGREWLDTLPPWKRIVLEEVAKGLDRPGASR